MRFASLFSAFLLVAAVLAPAQAAGPTPFSPADKLFTATFPGAPQKVEDTVPSPNGPAYKRVAYGFEGKQHMLMVGVVYVGDGPALTPAEQAQLLDGAVSSMVKGMPGLLTPEGVSPVTVDGRAGKQIKGSAQGAGYHARMFVTGRNLFMVQGLYDPRDPAAKAATEAFVASFRLAK